jgi:hypothetical protein
MSLIEGAANDRNSSRWDEVNSMVLTDVTFGPDRYWYSKYRWLSDSKTLFPNNAQRAALYEWNALRRQWEIGTLPSVLGANQLEHNSSLLYYLSSTNWTLWTSQPVVMSTCLYIDNTTQDISYFRFDGSNSTLTIAAELHNNLRNRNESHLPI